MKADPGKTYAQVVDGRVRWLFTADTLPEWNERTLVAIDVTGTPGVAPGWLVVDGEVLAPPAPSLGETALRTILELEDQQKRKVTLRADREFRLGVFEALGALPGLAGLLQLPAYVALKALDDAIKTERGKL